MRPPEGLASRALRFVAGSLRRFGRDAPVAASARDQACRSVSFRALGERRLDLSERSGERRFAALSGERDGHALLARLGNDGFGVSMLHGSIEDDHRRDTALAHALWQIPNRVRTVAFGVDPFDVLCEFGRDGGRAIAARQRADDDYARVLHTGE